MFSSGGPDGVLLLRHAATRVAARFSDPNSRFRSRVRLPASLMIENREAIERPVAP